MNRRDFLRSRKVSQIHPVRVGSRKCRLKLARIVGDSGGMSLRRSLPDFIPNFRIGNRFTDEQKSVQHLKFSASRTTSFPTPSAFRSTATRMLCCRYFETIGSNQFAADMKHAMDYARDNGRYRDAKQLLLCTARLAQVSSDMISLQ